MIYKGVFLKCAEMCLIAVGVGDVVECAGMTLYIKYGERKGLFTGRRQLFGEER
jgi:hypothetical protein